MKTAADLTQYISELLHDQKAGREYKHWSQVFILRMVNEAISRMALRLPGLFIESGELNLEPGSAATVPPHMRQYFKVQAYEKPNGPVTESNYNLKENDGLDLTTECHPTGNYRLKEYKYNAADPGVVLLSPPIPDEGADGAKLKVSYVATPADMTLASDLPETVCPYYTHIVDFVMYRAYSRPEDAVMFRDNAKLHIEAFEEFVERTYDVHARLYSEYYMGYRPDDKNRDPSTRSR